jgi:hypothetical protein
MDVTFPYPPSWDVDRQSLEVTAVQNQKRITCFVPMEFLTWPRVEFPTPEQALKLYDQRREEIERLIRQQMASDTGLNTRELVLPPEAASPII